MGDYVAPAELGVALNELGKKLESRLYTIRGDLLGRMDRMDDRLNRMDDRLNRMETKMASVEDLLKHLVNGYKKG